MKTPELARLDKLRRVMRLSSHGKGMAASIVETFSASADTEERDVARSVLLGHDVEDAIASLVSRHNRSSDLLTFLVAQAKIDAAEASRRADRLRELFERWVRAKQDRLLEARIMETRSLMISGILGAVTAMVASVAPVLSSFQLTLLQSGAGAPPPSPYMGLFFVAPGSFFLGLFFSPRRAALNFAVSILAYIAVAYLFSPLVGSL